MLAETFVLLMCRFSRTMKDHEYVVMCGDMGAPTVSHERLKADETLEGTKAIMLPFYLHHKNIPFGGICKLSPA